MFVIAGDVVRTRLDRREVDVVAGLPMTHSKRAAIAHFAAAQVLISIQSMILCDEPYLNEPGWANSGGTPKSVACECRLEPEASRSLTLFGRFGERQAHGGQDRSNAPLYTVLGV